MVTLLEVFIIVGTLILVGLIYWNIRALDEEMSELRREVNLTQDDEK